MHVSEVIDRERGREFCDRTEGLSTKGRGWAVEVEPVAEVRGYRLDFLIPQTAGLAGAALGGDRATAKKLLNCTSKAKKATSMASSMLAGLTPTTH